MLELKNICFSAPTDSGVKEILKDISLKIEDGFTAITGPNGGGKSTIAKIISGVYKPTSGKILLDGVDITDYSVTERAKAGISLGFQTPVKFKGITVNDIIRIASGRDITVSDACDYLSQVGLCARDYIDREINASLSGGELKRIEIASVLARGTKVSIFDEPEAGIDLWSFGSLIKVFEKMHEKIGGSIIIISHQERILDTADNIIVLSAGKLKAYGPKSEILPDLYDSMNNTCKVLSDSMKEVTV